jgi:hypothetical protein
MSEGDGGNCDKCRKEIVYDGVIDDSIICDGYCRRSFHLNCLNLGIGQSSFKTFRNCKEFLFFCDHCRDLQKNFVTRKNFLETERCLSGLVETLQSFSQSVDEVCRGAITSVSATLKKKPPPVESIIRTRAAKNKDAANAMSMMKKPIVTVTGINDEQPAISVDSPSIADDVFVTPSVTPKLGASVKKGFYGVSEDNGEISVVEEKRYFVVSRIDPSTTTDDIARFIKNKTGIDVRCQLLVPRGREVSELEFVSFKVGVCEADYLLLMKPEIWPAKVLVRDFIEKTRRKRSVGFPRLF